MRLDDCLAHHARYRPTKIAAIHGDDMWTYGRLGSEVARCARLFAQSGVKVGDRVAILTENSPWFLVVLFAATRVGAIFTPLNYRLSPAELSEMIDDADPAILIGQSGHLERLSASTLNRAGRLCWSVQPSDRAPLLADALKNMSNEPVDVSISGEDPVFLQYTSGTTGRSKGVISKHSAWIQSCAIQAPLKRMFEDSIFLAVLPMCYTGGLKASLETIFPGATLIICDRFDPDLALDAIEAHAVTNTYLVPTMFYAILDTQTARPRDLSSLRWVNCGGAPLSERRLYQAMELFDCHLTQGYGMTEMAGGSVCFAGPEDHISNGIVSPKLTSVGRPLIDCDVKLVDEEGVEVPVGTPGEVLVKSDRVMLGYWQDAEESPVDRHGYLHTGDIARSDADGYLYIVDRKKDMIISGGLNIYSKEVEDVLNRHDSVQEAFVVGVPDERWGESVHAFIVLRNGEEVTGDLLEQWCRSELGGYKCPRSFSFVAKRDLPINWGGKVQKRTLRDQYLANLEST